MEMLLQNVVTNFRLITLYMHM